MLLWQYQVPLAAAQSSGILLPSSSHSSQFCVLSKLVEAVLFCLIQFVNAGVKQEWTSIDPLKYAASYWPPSRLCTTGTTLYAQPFVQFLIHPSAHPSCTSTTYLWGSCGRWCQGPYWSLGRQHPWFFSHLPRQLFHCRSLLSWSSMISPWRICADHSSFLVLMCLEMFSRIATTSPQKPHATLSTVFL